MIRVDDRIKTTFLAIGFLAFGLTVCFYPTFSSCFGRIQADPGDTRFNNYVLEHGYQWLSGNPIHNDFWSPPIFFPVKNALAYSEIHLSAAPFYWFWRILGVEPDTSFQLWTIALVSLTLLLMFFTLKSAASFSSFASVIGVYVFAFANIRVAQIGHQQLLPQFYSVLSVYTLFKIFPFSQDKVSWSWDSRTSWISLFFVSIVFQLYASWYLGWFITFGFTVCFLVGLLFTSTRREIQSILLTYWKVLLVAALLSAAMLSWMGFHYLEALKQLSGRKWDEMDWLVPRVQSWFYMGNSNILYGWTSNWILSNFRLTQIQEHQLGLGLVTLVCSVLGMRRMWRSTWGKVVIIASLLIFVASLNFLGYLSIWRVVQQIYPGGTSIRAVCRVSLLFLIVFSIGVAAFLDQMKNRRLVYALAAVICLEQAAVTSSYDKIEFRKRVEKIVELIPQECEGFYYAHFLSTNETEPPYSCQLDAMWAQIKIRKPTVNGYSGNEPPGWQLSMCSVNSQTATEQLEQNLYKWLDRNQGLDKQVTFVIDRK